MMIKTKLKDRKKISGRVCTVLFTVLLLHSVVTFSIKLTTLPSADGYRIDFIAYYTAAKLIEQGEPEEIYVEVRDDFSVVTSGRFLETALGTGFPFAPTRFLYLPIFATPFRILALFDFSTAANIWLTINMTGILVITLLEWYFIKEAFPSISGLIITIALNLYSFPLLYGLTLGQTSILIYLIICLILYCTVRKYDVLAGVLLGAITALKFSPLIFTIYFLYRKKYTMVISSLTTMLSICLLSFFMYGFSLHKLYLDHLIKLSSMSIAGWSNQSIEAILLRLFTNNTIFHYHPVILPWYVSLLKHTFVILLIGSIFVCGRSITAKNQSHVVPLEFSLIVLCMLILPSISWLHYFALANLSIILMSTHCLNFQSPSNFTDIALIVVGYTMIAFHPNYTASSSVNSDLLVRLLACLPCFGTFILLYINLALIKGYAN